MCCWLLTNYKLLFTHKLAFRHEAFRKRLQVNGCFNASRFLASSFCCEWGGRGETRGRRSPGFRDLLDSSGLRSESARRGALSLHNSMLNDFCSKH
ncbi:hypothetical protein HPP92_021551 [Vanilla planifolia]|uniref:Uncharacterized protein n=1 Tax=Vanilla planifolia TaxID=51239 RepID=A0A835UJJ2_VANPL|nr:hypothetical protein HPP92_021551 [Vanilla planifolia]